MAEKRKPNPRTLLVHEGARRSQYNEMSEAIFLTQGFVYASAEDAQARFEDCPEDAFIYARYGNPTVAMFQDRMAALEGTEAAFATASGMAAVSGALMSALRAGDHVVAARALFGSCLYILEEILPRYGVEVTFVDGADITAWRSALRDNTKVVFFESLSNPTLELVDIQAVSKMAHDVGAIVMVDNVFATPIYSRAIDLGADVVIYSTTKHVDGQGRALGGIILGSETFIRKTVEPYMKHTGGAISPFNAWVMLKGLETMDLRVRAQTTSAQLIAESLVGHAAVQDVLYPGLSSHPQYDLCQQQMGAGGTVVSFTLKGGKAAAFEFMNNLEFIKISNNLGDAKSIITHPATTTHQRLPDDQKALLGIVPGLMRLSVGLEDPSDLIAEIKSALPK